MFDDKVGGWVSDDETVFIVRCPTEPEYVSPHEVQLPDLNFRFLCSYYLGIGESGIGTSATTLHHSRRGRGPITVEEVGNKIHFHFDLEHFKKEWEIVTTQLSRNLKGK